MVWTNYFVTLQVDYKMFDLCDYNQSLLYLTGQNFPKYYTLMVWTNHFYIVLADSKRKITLPIPTNHFYTRPIDSK